LEANASGVQIKNGSPGNNSDLRIRGFSSLSGNNRPLIVLDGVIFTGSIDELTQDAIGTIDILNEDKAKALYGSRGANGVLIITSKNNLEKENSLDQIVVRKNLQETAFFFPTLYTDQDGKVSFEFTTPEALSQWKMLVFAHDKDLNAQSEIFVTKTQKDLMVAPYLPRYFRAGDKMTITAQVHNMTVDSLNGIARLSFINPSTNENITTLFEVDNPTLYFNVG